MDNRRVQFRNMIDWQIIDDEYSRNFRNKADGQEAYPSSVAFGSLYIQRRLGLTDRELIDQISKNPYMHYFIGHVELRDEQPFDASLLVTFRKRLPEDVMNRIIERMFIEKAKIISLIKITIAIMTITTMMTPAVRMAVLHLEEKMTVRTLRRQ